MLDIKYWPVHIETITHPLEKEAMLSIQKNSFYDHLARQIGSLKVQAGAKAEMMLTGYPVTKKTSPRLYQVYRTVLKRLNCDQEYDLYIDFGYDLVAQTFGSGKTGHLIRVNSQCLSCLNDEELAALLGHEIGHILADHIQNRELLESMDILIKHLPMAGGIAKDTLWGFFSRWMIASEFTADRAALIASQSLEAVASLLLKQMGVAPSEDTIREICARKIRPMPEKLGMFYVMMAQKMPSFGMTARIQEICTWAVSQQFCKLYTYSAFMSRLLLGDPAKNNQDEKLLLLHRRAANGNVSAQERLGQLYLFGKDGLEMEPAIGIALLEEAAFYGGANAMYIYAHCLMKSIHGLKHNEKVEQQLLRAAASRNDNLSKQIVVPVYPSFISLPAVVKAFVTNRENRIQCTVNVESPGSAVDSDTAQIAQDAFWMSSEDAVYCTEMERIGERWYGTAITAQGIFGRMKDEAYPFFVPWKQYRDGEVCKRYKENGEYIFCNDRRLCRAEGNLIGTVAEILVKIKVVLDKN